MTKRFFTNLSITHLSFRTPRSGIQKLTTALVLTNLLLTCPAFAAGSSDPGALVGTIAVASVGIGGGVALLLLIYGGLMYSLSHGDPTKVEEAQQIITNALGGLVLIIFATLILRIVGKDILNLPGFPDIAI